MANEPHQERVIAELEELEAKRKALGQFFSSATYADLSHEEQRLLTVQHHCMCVYASILEQRIALF